MSCLQIYLKYGLYKLLIKLFSSQILSMWYMYWFLYVMRFVYVLCHLKFCTLGNLNFNYLAKIYFASINVYMLHNTIMYLSSSVKFLVYEVYAYTVDKIHSFFWMFRQSMSSLLTAINSSLNLLCTSSAGITNHNYVN